MSTVKKSRARPPRTYSSKKGQLCAVARQCGSCPSINDDYKKQLAHKLAVGTKLLTDGGVLEGARTLSSVPSPRLLGYRCYAKLAVRRETMRKNRRFRIGLFQPASHSVVENFACPVHHPALNTLIKEVAEHLEVSKLEPWDEKKKQGDLCYLTVKIAPTTRNMLLVFVVTHADARTALMPVVRKLRDHPDLKSVHMNINEGSNYIYGSKTLRLTGQRRLRMQLCGLDFLVGPTSFMQVNPWQAESIYRRILDFGSHKASGVALDLFSGSGITSIMLAQSGYRVISVERNPEASRDTMENVERNGLSEKEVEVINADSDALEAHIGRTLCPDVILVNPPRKGLSSNLLKWLSETLARVPKCRLIYISCEVNSLQRDLEYFRTEGISVKQLEAFDMLPHTDKLEWLAVLGRS